MEPTGELALLDLLAQAGWTMAPIYLCSVVGAAIFIRKLIELVSWKVGTSRLLQRRDIELCLEEGDFAEVKALCEHDESALGQVMAQAADAAVRNPARAEEEVVRVSTSLLGRLRSTVGGLAFIAQVSPLFGLLGTVIGMVDLFSAMEAAGHDVDTALLSAGIWKALLTTAAGLIVGIPALGAHAWLTSRLEGLRLALEDGTGRILNRALGRVGPIASA